MSYDVVGCYACTGVAFCHSCYMFGNAFASEKVGTEDSVEQIVFGTVAMNVGGVGKVYADVVEHCRGANVVVGKRQGVLMRCFCGKICHCVAVPDEDVAQCRSDGIIFVDD